MLLCFETLANVTFAEALGFLDLIPGALYGMFNVLILIFLIKNKQNKVVVFSLIS